MSAAAKGFLSGLNLNLGNGPVTGHLTGSVLTVAVGAPAIPLRLPVAGQTVSFAGATLTIDESTRTLKLSASVVASGGLGGTLSVSIAKADTTTLTGADLTATLSITGISVLGTKVDLSGTLSYLAGRPSASLTGKLAGDTVISDALTIKSGTTVTLATDAGLSVNGSAVLGSGAAAFTVTVAGAIKDAKNWSLKVDDTTDTPSFSPVGGLTISPAFTGSIADAAGSITFDVAGDDTGSWTVGGATLSLTHIEVSNDDIPQGLSCPETAEKGQVWFDVQGGLTDTAAGISGRAEACVVPAAKAFTLTASTPSITLPHQSHFSFEKPSVSIIGTGLGTSTRSIAVKAKATLTVAPDTAHTLTVPVTLAFASDGSFTASAGVDLGDLGLGDKGTGTLILASREIKAFDPTTVGSTGDAFDLPAGITVLVAYTPSGAVASALQQLELPVPSNLVARATLSDKGFAASVHLQFGAGDQGAKLFASNTPGGAAAYVNDIALGFSLGSSSGTLTVSGSAYLVLPKLYPSGKKSQVEVTLGGSLGVTTGGAVSVDLRFDIAGVNGPWIDAFGIQDLSVSEVAGSIGIKVSAESAGLPLPTIKFLVKDLRLPKAWGDAIGVQAGASISLSLALDVENPIVHIAIAGSQPNAVALKPFAVVKTVGGSSIPQSLVDSVQVKTAELLLAPLGGTDAAGKPIDAGATLVFDAGIAGVPVHVDGNVALLPYPSLTADASVGSFAVGPVTLQNTGLKITLKADPSSAVADFSFHGGFTDSVTGITFAATVDEGLSMSLANAAVSLHIAAGLPRYLQAGADLRGAVSASTSAVSFSASGNASLTVAGQNFGSVPFSYSTSAGAAWQQLQANAAQVAAAFRTAYGWLDSQVAAELNSLHANTYQIAWALQSAFDDGYDAALKAMYRAGLGIDTAITAAQNWFGATDAQVAGSLSQLGYQADQIAGLLVRYFGDADARISSVLNGIGTSATTIAGTLRSVFGDTDRQVAAAFNKAGFSAATIESTLKTVFGDGQAAIYNALQSLGTAGTGVLDSLAGVFNSGAYSPSAHPWYSVPLLWDVNGGSTAPGAAVLQWTWTGGHNQQWYVLPTDGGFAEIANRNSGLCLAPSSGAAGAGLVQTTCTGDPSQQWYLGVYQGQSLLGQTKAVWNRATGLYADVSGASTSTGATIDQWHSNGNWNQQWYFGPAVG